MRKLIALVFLLTAHCGGQQPAVQSPLKVVADLQAMLNAASSDDPSITLRLGTDFAAPAGAVIITSRAEGMAEMNKLARSGCDEVAVIYLSQRQVWVTSTAESKSAKVHSDAHLLDAVLKSAAEIELWHTHTDKGVEFPDEKSKETNALFWVVPSPQDISQLYICGHSYPQTKLRCVIASPHGALSYWCDGYEFMPPPEYLWRMCCDTSGHLQRAFAGATPAQLSERVKKYRGVVALHFEPDE